MLNNKKTRLGFKSLVGFLFLWNLLPPTVIEASKIEENGVFMFESGVPDVFLTDSKSELLTSDRHYQDGNHSLKWEFTSGDHLTIQNPIGYKKKKEDTFAIWVYNENPIDDHLLFEFGQKDEVNASFTFGLNFKGWRTAWVPFRNMDGNPEVGMDMLVVTAPKSVEQGEVYIDQVVLSTPVDVRHPTRDEQVPFVNLEADESASAHWQSLYLFNSWIPESFGEIDVTPEKEQGLEDISERYKDFILPELKAITEESMELLREEYKSYKIVRDNDSIYGRPVNLVHLADIYPKALAAEMKDTINAIDVTDYTDFMLDIAVAYQSTDDSLYKAELKGIFIDLVDHMYDQGWAKGSSLGAMHHLGYNLRGFYPAVFLMKEELELENMLTRTQEVIGWYTGIGRIFENLDESYSNVDILNTTLQGMLVSILIKEDDDERIGLLEQLTKWLDNGLMPAPGLMPALKVDGSGYHHMGFYPAYTKDAFNGMSPVIYMLSRTPFAISEQSHELLKKAVLATRLYANKHEWLLSVTGRHPTGLQKVTSHPFKFMALAGSPDGKQEIDPELAAAYLRLVEPGKVDDTTQYIRDKGFKAELNPTGHWTMNYGALSIHRRDNWLVGARGHNRYQWAGELYSNANWYGRYTTYGQIQIMNQETNVASGFSHDGWDWNRWPGTTTIHLPFDELKGKSFTEMLLTDETFAGGLNIQGENGMFAMKLHENPKYDDSHRARKSVFMFDNRIIALGSNIENTDTEHMTETTLFQNHMVGKNDSILMEASKPITSFPFEETIELSKPYWMIDNKGNGFYIPSGQTLGIHKKSQHSKNQQNGKDTIGDFATAWIEHGKAPENESYEYAILVGIKNEGQMNSFTKRMSNPSAPYTVLQKDRNAHIVSDRETKTTGYALFEANDGLNKGHIVAVDTPSMVMVKEQEDKLILSAVDPDLRLYDGIDEEQYDSIGNFIGGQGPYSRPWIANESQMHKAKLTVKGKWTLVNEGNNYRIHAYIGDDTVIEFDFKDAMPMEIELIKSGK